MTRANAAEGVANEVIKVKCEEETGRTAPETCATAHADRYVSLVAAQEAAQSVAQDTVDRCY